MPGQNGEKGIKAVVFDLDGTISDTIGTISYYANKALTSFGFKTFSEEEYKHFVGDGAVKLIERALKAGEAFSEENFEKVFKLYNENYDSAPLYLTRLYDGIMDMLLELKKDNIKIGILSNKPHTATKGVVEALLGDELVSVFLGAREGYPLKPDPSVLFDVLLELGATKEQAVFVGDTSVDILTGKNANTHTIGVKWGFREENELIEAGAEFLVSSPMEICDIVKKL